MAVFPLTVVDPWWLVLNLVFTVSVGFPGTKIADLHAVRLRAYQFCDVRSWERWRDNDAEQGHFLKMHTGARVPVFGEGPLSMMTEGMEA